MKRILIALSIVLFISCSDKDKVYNIEQKYESIYVNGEMIYAVQTRVMRENLYEHGEKRFDLVYKSVIQNINSQSIDSILLHEKSLANMRVSEFEHLDELTDISVND